MQSTLLTTFDPPYGTLCLRGELSTDCRAELRRRLEAAFDAGCRHLTVDAGEVTHTDVDTLRLLVATCTRLKEVGGRMQIVRASSIFAMMAGLAGCLDLLPPTPAGDSRAVVAPTA